jgi:hypothetical protein
VVLFIFILTRIHAVAQPVKKEAEASRMSGKIRIDGILDEDPWKIAKTATDFIQRIPYNGKAATYSTEVRFIYDNSAFYIGAFMHDPHPDSIPSQLGLRDSYGLNADYFMVMMSPFNDGINAFCFLVYVSDVQSEFKLSGESEPDFPDMSWDAVWQSKAKKNDSGWVAEIRIPYSAIRFSRTPSQEWGINCIRDFRRSRENSSWNFIDSKISGFVNQEGILKGIINIKPPLRLSISPYVSGYIEKNPDDPDWLFSYNYGADLKYGINQSFTLDMTLIPDFGQVPSDDRIYNFSPFEIRYDEKRQFFTEGTELFNKGGIFYSRRIGAEPVDYSDVYPGLDTSERIDQNPMQAKLLNATKVSGRTNKGLGTGVFNAMSGNTWATVTDTITGESRKVLTQGFTNYNMVVFDQALKNNSYFDVLNTNYYLPDKDYCANVSGIDFKFANKKYTWAVIGNGFISQKYTAISSPDLGYHYLLGFGKISGNFQFDIQQLLETDNYDPNDMGFNARNNKFNTDLTFKYNIYEPFGKFLSTYNELTLRYNCLYSGFEYSSFEIEGSSHFTTLKHLDFGMNLGMIPLPYHDYYEPRVEGYVYIQPAEYNPAVWISTDYRKKLAIDGNLAAYHASRYHSNGFSAEIAPRFRATDRLFFRYSISYEDISNNVGFVSNHPDSTGMEIITFGKRDIRTLTNVLSANFMFSSKISLDFRMRHYWATAAYSQFYTLNADGTLTSAAFQEGQDVNFNQFNIDLTYIWNFAPGSQFSIVWKNAINTFTNVVNYHCFENFRNTIESPASNSFSIRVLYYLDALYFKKKRSEVAK